METYLLKILWVNHIFLDNDVYSTFPLQLIYSLRERGHQVHLIVPSLISKRKQKQDPRTTSVPIINLQVLSSLSFFFSLLFYIPKMVKKDQPNVIIGNIYEYPGLIIAKLFRNVKLVLDMRASIGGTSGLGDLIEKILYSTSMRLANNVGDGITVASSALREEICQNGINRSKIRVVTNGVSLDLFDYKEKLPLSAKLREKFNLSNKFVLMYHGSLCPMRGLPETIEALSIVKLKHPDIFFFVLGQGTKEYEEMLTKLVEEKSLSSNFYLHKPVNHKLVPEFLGICDFGVIPLAVYSYPLTSCPLKIAEYLAMTRPVLLTDIYFSREVMELGKCGFLIPSNKTEDIAIGIEYMYQQRNLLNQMGLTGRDIVEKNFSWTEKSRDLEDFIKELLDD
jgi:glycosyltransferase involved in cell wall biosynthesis